MSYGQYCAYWGHVKDGHGIPNNGIVGLARVLMLHIHTYPHIYIYIYTYTYIHIHTYIYIYTFIQLHIHIHIYTCMETEQSNNAFQASHGTVRAFSAIFVADILLRVFFVRARFFKQWPLDLDMNGRIYRSAEGHINI